MNLLPFRIYQFFEYTGRDHALVMGDLLRTEYGLRCGHRAVYAALDKLWAVGRHIPEYRDVGEGCRLRSRSPEQPEGRVLPDAVSVCFSGHLTTSV